MRFLGLECLFLASGEYLRAVFPLDSTLGQLAYHQATASDHCLTPINNCETPCSEGNVIVMSRNFNLEPKDKIVYQCQYLLTSIQGLHWHQQSRKESLSSHREVLVVRQPDGKDVILGPPDRNGRFPYMLRQRFLEAVCHIKSRRPQCLRTTRSSLVEPGDHRVSFQRTIHS